MSRNKECSLSVFVNFINNPLLSLFGLILSLALIAIPSARAATAKLVGPHKSSHKLCTSGDKYCVTSIFSFISNLNFGSFPSSGVMALPNGAYILPVAGYDGSPYGTGSIGVVAALYPQENDSWQEVLLGTFAPDGAAPSVSLANANPTSAGYSFDGGTIYGGACGLGGIYQVTAPATLDGNVIFTNLYNNFSDSNTKYYSGNPSPAGGNPNVCGYDSDNTAYLGGSNPAGVLPQTDGTTLVSTQGGGKFASGTLSHLTTDNAQVIDFVFQQDNLDEFNGFAPYGPLVQVGPDTVYGVTLDDSVNQTGTLYKATRSGGKWSVSLAYNFPPLNGAMGLNGQMPIGLSLGDDGNIYVATFSGGLWAGGTIGRYIPPTDKTEGKYEKLLDMGKNPNDLCFPLGAPLAIKDKATGNLYIFFTGSNGGDLNTNDDVGSGGVAALTKLETSVPLWNFTNGADGAYPTGPMFFQNGAAIITNPGGGVDGYGAVVSVPLTMDDSTVFHEPNTAEVALAKLVTPTLAGSSLSPKLTHKGAQYDPRLPSRLNPKNILKRLLLQRTLQKTLSEWTQESSN